MNRYLAMHDYGMGARYWWIDAPSALDIPKTFAEVVVIEPPAGLDFSTLPVITWDTTDLPRNLRPLRARRDAQSQAPGFGALVGRGTIYLRRPWEEDDEIYFLEYDAGGWRTRQVCLNELSGDAERTTDEDWAFNPPEDLWDPELAEFEITAEEFEAAWARARPPTS